MSTPFADDPTAPPAPFDLMINTTMTKENLDYSVDNFEGDFFGFQAYFESLQVSLALPLLVFRFGCLILGVVGPSPRCSLDPCWVSALWSWDLCPARCLPLTNFFSDMNGLCPNGTGPPDCISGPKWSPNDPLFFLHHAVRGPSASFPHLANLGYVDGR